MAAIPSSNVTRLYTEGTGVKMCLYRMVRVSSGDTYDTSTDFLGGLTAAGCRVGGTTLNGTLVPSGTTLSLAGVAGWAGLSSGTIYVTVTGAGV